MNKFYLDEPDEPTAPVHWTLAQIYADLGTLRDVAKALDVTYWRVHKWVERREKIHCPAPVRRFPRMDVYSIEEWHGWFGVWKKKITRVTPENKWIDAKPNGSGEPFFTYDNPEL